MVTEYENNLTIWKDGWKRDMTFGWFGFDYSLLFSKKTAGRPIEQDCNTTKHCFPPTFYTQNNIHQNILHQNRLNQDCNTTKHSFPPKHHTPKHLPLQHLPSNTKQCFTSEYLSKTFYCQNKIAIPQLWDMASKPTYIHHLTLVKTHTREVQLSKCFEPI